MNNNNIFTAKINDLYRLCQRRGEARFSAFLDEAQQADAEVASESGFNTMWFGGFPEARRRILGVFPEWETPSEDAFDIDAIRISASFGGDLSHRDCLGSLMSLGIDRSKLGDILIDGTDAYVFVCGDISDYIIMNISKIGGRGVAVKKCALSEVKSAGYKFEIKDTVAASERLDAVIASILKLSRAQAAKLISRELVQINHRIATDNSKTLSPGDIISARGFGRFEYIGAGANTGSGRLHIKVKRFI